MVFHSLVNCFKVLWYSLCLTSSSLDPIILIAKELIYKCIIVITQQFLLVQTTE